uniref:Putative secreted protein n=1 Tax=Ixodes ricinus TaxID=34613 RepID=A0A6B0V4L6_IXORI
MRGLLMRGVVAVLGADVVEVAIAVVVDSPARAADASTAAATATALTPLAVYTCKRDGVAVHVATARDVVRISTAQGLEDGQRGIHPVVQRRQAQRQDECRHADDHECPDAEPVSIERQQNIAADGIDGRLVHGVRRPAIPNVLLHLPPGVIDVDVCKLHKLVLVQLGLVRDVERDLIQCRLDLVDLLFGEHIEWLSIHSEKGFQRGQCIF